MFDPSVSGFLTVAIGAAFGACFARAVPGTLWAGIVGGALWLVPHVLEWATPQIGALAMNGSQLNWLLLPLFGVGVLAGPLCRVSGARPGGALAALGLNEWSAKRAKRDEEEPANAVAQQPTVRLTAAARGSEFLGASMVLAPRTSAHGHDMVPVDEHRAGLAT